MKIKYVKQVGQRHDISEDFLVHSFDGNRLKLAVGDWASNLSGGPYEDAKLAKKLKTGLRTRFNGGVIGASVAYDTIVQSKATGPELIRQLNEAIAAKYEELIGRGYKELARYHEDRTLVFTGYIGHVIATPQRTIVTAVGDVRVVVDGVIVAGKTKRIDEVNAQKRAEYIAKHGLSGVNEYMKGLILDQFQFQNSPGEFSYPAIDGTGTLANGIKVWEMQGLPRSITLWSDGYVVPDGDYTIEELERKLMGVYHDDPCRCREYPAVYRELDDRTALEVTELDDWTSLRIEEVRPLFVR